MVTKYTPDFSLPAFDKERLLYLFKEYAYKKGEFPLSSGKISKHYFNSKSLLLLPEGAFLVAKGIMEKIKGIEVDAIGGAALGAAPMAGALAALSYFEPFFQKVKYFVDRKKAKEHGDYKRIEGPDLKEGAKIIVIEDVATTGSSAMGTVEVLQNSGYEILKVIALLDRKAGAAELFAGRGISFDALITIDELGIDLQ